MFVYIASETNNFALFQRPSREIFLIKLCVRSPVSGRSSAYGDPTVEGHPAGPGSVSSSTGAISTTAAQQEGDGSEGEVENEGDVTTSNRSDATNHAEEWLPKPRVTPIAC